MPQAATILRVISVIICSIDDSRYEAVLAHYRRVFGPHPHEFVRIADARSLAEGYNRGIDRARGDTLVFSHDDVEPLCDDLGDRLLRYLGDHDLLGLAGTTKLIGPKWVNAGPPYLVGQIAQVNRSAGGWDVCIWGTPQPCVGGIQAMDGVFLCVKRELARSLRFDQTTFDGFHLYDLDFTFRAYLAGARLAVCCDLAFIHASMGEFGTSAWTRYAQAFVRKHQAALPPTPMREWTAAGVRVHTREQLLEVMTPLWWGSSRGVRTKVC